jgi:peroxin-2
VTDTTVKIPYKTNCENECRYCYYCIVGVLVNCQEEIEDGWECLRCGQVVDGASREKNQVVEGEGEVGYQVGAEEEGEEDADSEEEG